MKPPAAPMTSPGLAAPVRERGGWSSAIVTAVAILGLAGAGTAFRPSPQGDVVSGAPHAAVAAIVATPVKLVPSEEDRNRLLAAMPPAQQRQAFDALASSELELVSIGAIDWGDVDGDLVTIAVGPVSYTRRLSHEVAVMTFLVLRGAARIDVTITGVADGRPPAGISVGLGSAAGWTRHILQPGQTVQAQIVR